jgi:hypothetical protein
MAEKQEQPIRSFEKRTMLYCDDCGEAFSPLMTLKLTENLTGETTYWGRPCVRCGSRNVHEMYTGRLVEILPDRDLQSMCIT